MTEFILEIPLSGTVHDLTALFNIMPRADLHLSDKGHEFLAWGDPICTAKTAGMIMNNASLSFIVNNIYGHYYFLYLNKETGEILAGNSMFSLLPLYYHCTLSALFLSNNAVSLGRHLGMSRTDKRFVLETILFNYPLFNNSIVEGIALLPANSSLRISDSSFYIVSHTRIADYFKSGMISQKEAVMILSDKFVEAVEKYLPEEKYACSVTGGLDGRTLASAGRYHRRDFTVFAFGNEESKDLILARDLSERLDLHFRSILLEDDYVKSHSLACGREFIEASSGTATFARAHYLFSARSLSDDYRYMVTGNFGSEILRAAHVAGVVISANLFTLFNADQATEALRIIRESREFRCLNIDAFSNEWQALQEDVLKLPCFDPSYSGLTKNQRFYVFVYEELFRKYFGAELANQFRYIRNRTPFLDIDFVKAILETELAGIHSEFFEHNPFKRYKGQVLYAHIIKKTFPPFGKVMTDKGYRPEDLISFFGKAAIVRGYLGKKRSARRYSDDPNSVVRAWMANREQWQQSMMSDGWIDKGENLEDLERELLFKILSLSYITGGSSLGKERIELINPLR